MEENSPQAQEFTAMPLRLRESPLYHQKDNPMETFHLTKIGKYSLKQHYKKSASKSCKIFLCSLFAYFRAHKQ